ncbi:glycosyltransferase family 2 protein [Patescibacteria group bacterium]|nr:glycosyltransferase family 2 protein [Patescibacteria group bacterium]
MEKKTKVTIVILNYNGKQDTLKCLESIRKLVQDKVQVETFVVDNGSSDDSVKSVKKQFPQVKVIENRKNLGFCEGNNVGVKAAFKEGADYVLILNNDTLVDPLLVEELVKTAKREHADVASPKIYFAPGYEFHKDRYNQEERGKVIWYAGGLIDWKNVLPSHRGVDEVDQGQFDQSGETKFVTGCATLVSKEVFEDIGLYDPVYMFYFEDADFSIRARKRGYKVLYTPKAVLWHKNAASFGGSGSPFQDYFITRNRLIFGLRHAPIRSKFALLRESLRFLAKGPARRRRAIADAMLRRLPDINSIR